MPPSARLWSKRWRPIDNLLVVVTIRSDSFAALQAETSLSAIPRLPFDLPALPLASFKEVIEGPGRLAQPPIRVEEALTAQLVSDLDQADALPLLAFTLERLVVDYGADGVIELAEYRDGLGGLDGAIGRAVEAAFAAAREDRRLPDDLAALEKLARAAFIPWLLRLDGADQAPKRRVALLRELPADARPLVEHLVDQRLLVSDLRDDGETTVEVSHEAVLRHWGLLGRWIGGGAGGAGPGRGGACGRPRIGAATPPLASRTACCCIGPSVWPARRSCWSAGISPS